MIKESKWGTSCKSGESNILKTQVIFPIAIVNSPELYFLLQVQITKIKITLHGFIGDGYMPRNITYESQLNQSVSVLKFQMQSVMVLLKENI